MNGQENMMNELPSFPRVAGRVTAAGIAGNPVVLEQLERAGGQVRSLEQVAQVHAGASVHIQVAMQLSAGEQPRIIDVEISQRAWRALSDMAGGKVLDWVARPTLCAAYQPYFWAGTGELRPVVAAREVFDPLAALVRGCTGVAQLQHALLDQDAARVAASDFVEELDERTPYRVQIDAEPMLVLAVLYAGDELALERAAVGEFDVLELTRAHWTAARECVGGLRREAAKPRIDRDLREQCSAERHRERQAA
jgi:hypothetical protein